MTGQNVLNFKRNCYFSNVKKKKKATVHLPIEPHLLQHICHRIWCQSHGGDSNATLVTLFYCCQFCHSFTNTGPSNSKGVNSMLYVYTLAQGMCQQSTVQMTVSIIKWKWKPLSCVWLFATPWTVPHQAPLSMKFSSKNTAMGCHSLLQVILPTQGSNLDLLHCRQILYQLSQQGSPSIISSF